MASRARRCGKQNADRYQKQTGDLMARRRTRKTQEAGSSAELGSLIGGFILAAAGVYLLTNQVHVGAGPFGGWSWLGPNSFGLVLVPLLLGVGILCVSGRSRIGQLLTAIGGVLLLASIIEPLRITFRPTSLFSTLLMLGLTIAGVGLMARALLAGREPRPQDNGMDDDDDDKSRLQVELALAQDRIRALESPRADTVATSRQSVDDDLAELVRQKRSSPPATRPQRH
jgi:hypothetical protein